MKSIKVLSVIFLLSMMMLPSCSKDDTAPNIVITSPVEGSTLEKGKSYPVTGTITDDTELAEIDAGGVKITTFDSKTSHSLANITLPIPATTTNTAGTFTVTATDKEGNKATKVVNFIIK
ncbi:MAG: hypothetical protein IPN89_03165 [Saprospiraceae bacterium]|nr:hypothetical protein [Saprospiraceae bacterium]